MFLLIPDGNDSEFTLSVFTFHDVSINTGVLDLRQEYLYALHSTMFLLIPIASGHRRKRSHFTFHDVSINTRQGEVLSGKVPLFTFHDVSINTVTLSFPNSVS